MVPVLGRWPRVTSSRHDRLRASPQTVAEGQWQATEHFVDGGAVEARKRCGTGCCPRFRR